MSTAGEDGESCAKRPRLECAATTASTSDKRQVSANSCINLKFHDCYRPLCSVHPTYTHQIFENEKILLSGCDPTIDVFVSVMDLTHRVEVQCDNEDFEYIRENMCKKLPAGTSVTRLNPQQAVRGEDPTAVSKSCDSSPAAETTTSAPAPMGVNIATFSVSAGSEDEVYELRLASFAADGQRTVDTLQRAEMLAVWFIETATPVDFQQQQWEMVWVYRQISGTTAPTAAAAHADTTTVTSEKENNGNAECTSNSWDGHNNKARTGDASTASATVAAAASEGVVYAIAGYMTLYSFSNPYVGVKMRICQALVLPSAGQRRGLGRHMMLSLYRYIHQHRQAIVKEITVEDPCEGFSCLRDAVDVEWLLEHAREVGDAIPGVISSGDVSSVAPFSQLCCERFVAGEFTKDKVQELGRILRITPQQVRFTLQALAFVHVRLGEPSTSSASKGTGAGGSDLACRWNAQVKRHILKDMPELRNLPTKESIQRELATLLGEEVERCEKVLRNKHLAAVFHLAAHHSKNAESVATAR